MNKYGLKKPYFLYAGQWRPHKGIGYLIKGMRLFRQRFGQPEVKLVIVGQPADKFPWLAKEIKKAVKEKMAMAPGFIDEQDLPAIYSQAELFVFPSLYEGFGLPPLEAMACGTPVASSNLSCLPEVFG
ncbi:unnamed protein product [marine sediment metagenome]|uniref:Glycosyl transferase family 1 domain-containing protein n=1 Tax=marine sediment metagenome TaxID=412755 RepID=X1NVH8_9ZZZZ